MRDFQKDLEDVRAFCIEHKIGFGGEDKEDGDASLYTIAYQVDDYDSLFLYLTEDETEEADQIIIDTIIIKIYEDVDLISSLFEKCKGHGIIM